MATNVTASGRYWHERSAPKWLAWAHKGKQARFSYISHDSDGRPVRKWHGEVRRLFGAPTAKSLTGMTGV